MYSIVYCAVFCIQNKSEFAVYLLLKLQYHQKSSLHYHQDRERRWKVTHQAFDGKGIVEHCECGWRKATFCASNILLTAARSDLGITCKYISHSGPPLYTERQTRTHLNTHPPTPPIVGSVPSSRFLYRSKLSKLCLKVNEGWLALPLSLSLPLSSLTSQFFFLTCHRFWARW